MARSAPKGFWRGGSTSGVNKGFLAKVYAAVIAAGGTYVYIVSGKRTTKTNTGVSNSNHLYGHALDGYAFIPGQGRVPLGTLLKASASGYGLRSGDVPGFYKGGPDPNHVDDGYNVNHGQPISATTPAQPTQPLQRPDGTTTTPTTTDPTGQGLDAQMNAGLQNISQLPGAPLTSAPLLGDSHAQPVIPAQVGQTWQLIAANGPVSTDTLRLASLASLASNGGTAQ